MKLTTSDMEYAIMNYFNVRVNIIVPNVSWGMCLHECDLLIVTPAGYATEVEIKVDKYDLIKDKEKQHKHESKKIKSLYFGIPDYLLEYKSHIPEHAGIIVVDSEKLGCAGSVKRIQYPKPQYNYKWTELEMYQLARLGTMRILKERKAAADWRRQYNSLKETLNK
jgi:hypothetical protein